MKRIILIISFGFYVIINSMVFANDIQESSQIQSTPYWNNSNYHNYSNNPFERMFQLQKQLDRLFNDSFYHSWEEQPFSVSMMDQNTVRVDLLEDEQQYQILADLPGIDKSEIQVSVENQVLTIRVQKQSSTEEENKSDGGKWIIRERSINNIERSIQLPKNVDSNHIEAKYENGVLKISIPKIESKEKENIIPIV